MSNGEDGAIRKGVPHRALDERIAVHVHARGGLVHHEHLAVAEQGATHAQELPLAQRKVGAVVHNLVVELLRGVLNHAAEADLPEDLPEGNLGVLVERVQVGANGACEHERILGDHRHLGAEQVQAERGDVHAVDGDGSRRGLHDAKQRDKQGRLPAARPAAHAQLLASERREREILEHQG